MINVCQAAKARNGVELLWGVRTWGCLRFGAQGVGSEWSGLPTKIKQEITVYSCMTLFLLSRKSRSVG